MAGIEDVDSTSLIEIMDNDDEEIDTIENKVRSKLQTENWWLQDYWKEKGLPHEQIIIETSVGNLEIFNFGDSLEQRHFDELQQIVKVLATINKGELLKAIKYLLIDNVQLLNPNSGEETNGKSTGSYNTRTLKLYPRGIKFMQHRIPTASNFSGTLIHEFTHTITDNFKNEWIKEFGWHELKEPKLLHDNRQYYETENPQNCVSDYALYSPDEDICESMVAYITHFEKLDPHKKEFLESRLPMSDANEDKIKISRRLNEEIELPKVPEPVKYRRKRRKKFSIN
ncbi:hypothetical protein D4R87_03090 [bacterium]|nr:MAG: hypothetical protein D4R87_03090 [bacterium]